MSKRSKSPVSWTPCIDGISMIETSTILMGVVAGAIMLFFLSRLCTKDKTRNLVVYQALSSPSMRNVTNAFDKRLALASREAEKGYRLCPGCHFENPQRGASCVLCGWLLPEEDTSFSRFFRGHKQDSANHFETNVSSRQRRIRQRKEWTRQRRNDGAIVWHHNVQHEDAEHRAGSQFLACVLQEASSESTADRRANEADTSENDQAAPNPGLATFTVPVIVSEGDEVVFNSLTVNVDAMATKTRAQESVHNAQLDFPTKLAHFIGATAALFRETTHEASVDEAPVPRIHVLRGSPVTDSVQAIASLTPAQARGAIRVEFIGEAGIDAGGVYREWSQLLNQAMVASETGIFVCVNSADQAFYLNPHSPHILGEEYLTHFRVAGRLLGRALLEGNATGFHLALPLLKIILGLPVSFGDLEYYDPDIYKNLKWLLDNDGVDALGLDFTVTEKLPSGKTRTVELIAGGGEIDVTDANKHDFVERKFKYLLFVSVSTQLRVFLQGLYEVIPLESLILLDAEELGFVLSGSDEIDVDDWEDHTLDDVEAGGPSVQRLRHLPCYINFWKVVRELSADERRRLLQFATGSTRPPPGGFGSLTSYDGRLCLFTLRGVEPETTHGNLRSHACFNRLDIPTYWGLKSLRNAVHAAISSDVDGFTIA